MDKPIITNKEQMYDAMFLTDSKDWPCWPACPVKRPSRTKKNDPPTVGVVFEGKPIVYEVNMFMIGDTKSLENIPKHKYESFVDLVADGWMVD